MIESFLAGLTLLACLLLGLRLAIGRGRRLRLDSWLRWRYGALRRALQRWLTRRKLRREAARATVHAEAAIRRARGGRWDGNVYRPNSFRRPRKPH